MKKQITQIDEFYSNKKIKEKNATYNIVIGERSNGKTFSALKEIIENYFKNNKQGCIIRRWEVDFKGQSGPSMFKGIIATGILNDTEWTGIDFKNSAWWFYKYDEDLQKKIYDIEPFCYAFALNSMEHYKSTSYPDVTIIVFDEFLTRKAPLPDEFVLFMNMISTIVRRRTDVIIWMLANTVNFDSPYWKEMGIMHVRNMKKGSIDVYKYGNSKLTVAVEYCNDSERTGGKESDMYFAFDNPKLQMITGGAWELAIYPRLPMKYKQCDVRFRYFIQYETDLLECEIIKKDGCVFTFIHMKTTPIKEGSKEIVFSPAADPRPNWRRHITNTYDSIGKKIYDFFIKDKVYYQDNVTGEIVRNYLQNCKQFSIIKA